MAGLGFSLEIDSTECMKTIGILEAAMKPEQFNNAMYGIFNRTGGHVRKILRSDLPRQYEVKPSEISQAVKRATVTRSGLGVGCCIPIVAPRKNIGGGGRGFSASGGAHGWNSLKRRYRVKARIVKSGQSTLPQDMNSYGGEPPFRNLGSTLGGLTFTREGKGRLPIRKVSGIAIPQMPLNRSEEDVQKDIMQYLAKETERRLFALLATGR